MQVARLKIYDPSLDYLKEIFGKNARRGPDSLIDTNEQKAPSGSETDQAQKVCQRVPSKSVDSLLSRRQRELRKLLKGWNFRMNKTRVLIVTTTICRNMMSSNEIHSCNMFGS